MGKVGRMTILRPEDASDVGLRRAFRITPKYWHALRGKIVRNSLSFTQDMTRAGSGGLKLKGLKWVIHCPLQPHPSIGNEVI